MSAEGLVSDDRTAQAGRRSSCFERAGTLGGLLLFLLVGLATAQPGGEGSERFAGLSLAEALGRLSAGTHLEIVFSESIVPPRLRVEAEPEAVEPEAILAELLAGHGLTTQAGPGGRLVVVRRMQAPGRIEGETRERSSGVPLSGITVRLVGENRAAVSDDRGVFRFDSVAPGRHALEGWQAGLTSRTLAEVGVESEETARVVLRMSLLTLEEIVITPSLTTVSWEEPVVALTLEAERLADLPVGGSDPVRATGLLPGVSGNDFSARFSLHGGRPDEVLVLLDGLELLDPFHLKDFESPFSIVAPETVERLDLFAGGFPASYGDRMGGVLEMTTRRAPPERGGYVAASLLDAGAGGSGRFAAAKGDWLISARRSLLEQVGQALDRYEKPEYWDSFNKLGYRASPRQGVSLRWLASDDGLDLRNVSLAGSETTATEYSNSNGWLRYDALWGGELSFEAILFAGRLDRDRQGLSVDDRRAFSVTDRRALDTLGVELRGSWSISPGSVLSFGLSTREMDADYDYTSRTGADLADLEASPVIEHQDRLIGRQSALYVTDKLRVAESLTVEIGLRFDESEILDESYLSPRLNLAWVVGRRGVLRVAWGVFRQSQRAYELQIEDGETGFSPSERSRQAVVGYEHFFDGGLQLRAGAQRRDVSSPRVRYENLIDPIGRFPEVALDRVRIAPERAKSRSLDLLLRRRQPRWSWWASYVLSSIEDRLEGLWVVRRIDQTHALGASVDYRFGSGWTLGAVGQYHTGWPSTPFTFAGDDGAPTALPTFGALNSGRLDDYARLDLRLAHTWTFGERSLRVYVDILNAPNRSNPRGFEPVAGSDTAGAVETKTWLPRVAIAGVNFRF